MAKAKAKNPKPSEKVSESVQWVEPQSEGGSPRISLGVSRKQLDDCIEAQKRELAHTIKNRNAPPIDGGIAKMVAALDALSRIDPTETDA